MINLRPMFIASILAGLFVASAQAQLKDLPKINRFGLDGFRLMLQQRGLQATQTQLGTALDQPGGTVAIILGDLKTVTRIRVQLEDFVDNGGALLIASDLRAMDVDNVPIHGAWIKDTPSLSKAERKSLGYQELEDCPIISRFDRKKFPRLFFGVKEVVANRPGEVDCQNNVQQIAWLPSRRKPPFMVTYHQNDGRMLLIADHSIFINEMLVHGDNARFANNVIGWLSSEGKRTKLVLINDGQVLPDWSFGATPPAVPLNTLLRAVQRGGLRGLPIGDSVVPIVNESVARYQRENRFNEDVPKLLHFLFGYRLVRTAMLIMTALLLVTIVRWFVTRSRPRRWLSSQDWTKPSEPKMVAAVRGKHYLPYMRTLVREFFLESGVSHLDQKTQPVADVKDRGGTRRIARQVEDLWLIATEQKLWKMSAKEFDETLVTLRELRQLQLAGDLRLEWHGQTSTGN